MIFWSAIRNDSYTGDVNDIWVDTSVDPGLSKQLYNQYRWTGTVWMQIGSTPLNRTDPRGPEGRIDAVPSGGTNTFRLSKSGANAYETTWLQASDGVVFLFNQTNISPLQSSWMIQHNLGFYMVEAQVFVPGYVNASNGNVLTIAPSTQTIIYPDVTFNTANICTINLAYPTTGTAVIRR